MSDLATQARAFVSHQAPHIKSRETCKMILRLADALAGAADALVKVEQYSPASYEARVAREALAELGVPSEPKQ